MKMPVSKNGILSSQRREDMRSNGIVEKRKKVHTHNPHYERKTRADRGKKRPRETNASSSSTTQNPSSSSLQIDIITDDNDVESPQSNSSSPSQTISSSSNVVSGVHQNPPHENHDLNNLLS
ncbi:hypothetical protein Tco_1562385 [Tanacetum coccineum]